MTNSLHYITLQMFLYGGGEFLPLRLCMSTRDPEVDLSSCYVLFNLLFVWPLIAQAFASLPEIYARFVTTYSASRFKISRAIFHAVQTDLFTN